MLPVLLLALGAQAAEPHYSYPKLVTANGYGVAVFNASGASGAVVELFSDHLYQQYSPESAPTRDLMYDSYFGLRTDSQHGWLTEASDWGMLTGSNVMWMDRSQGDLAVTEYAFAPMDFEAPVLVQLLRIENTGASAQSLSAYSLHNLHVGDDSNENEYIQPRDGGLYVGGQNSSLGFDMVPLVAPSRTDCTPNNPWYAVGEGWDLDQCSGSNGDDRVGAMQWDVELGAGEVTWVGVVLAFSSGWGDQTDEVSSFVGGRAPEALLADEQQWWADWQAEGEIPSTLSEEEKEVYLQALAFLKMGQVREEGDAYGQVLASLPLSAPVGNFQHIWNIAWVRDGAYGIRGLSRSGHHEEARAALAFQVQEGKTGEWRSYVAGMDHALSVCRIYGNGQEWTDVDQDGPNIEYDNFGLYLWAAGMYVQESGDTDFVVEHQAALFDRTADVLVRLIEPETGLLAPDSSIWEEHWNGHQKHFTYSSLWGVRGLREAANMAEAIGETEKAAEYRAEADGLATAIAEQLVNQDGVLMGNLEEYQDGAPALDLAAVDAFNNGTLDPRSAEFASSYAAWNDGLRVPHGKGFARNDDGDLYDSHEWLMIDLRVAEALRRACREDEAAELEDWITAQAQQNKLIVPELFDPDNADYAGPAPMMGFGSGLYVLQMHTRQDLSGECGSWDTAGDDTGGPYVTQPACGCASKRSGAPVGAALGMGLAALMVLSRRKNTWA
ncbi:MAG: glycoside hydrolase family 15 protein [Myxococcota bacterium]|nr:glycoside hydrolase family 15 protein [Myxococcota bacterium]